MLDNTPERMREVRGLGAVVAARIAAAWRDSSGLRELTVFLRGHGIAAAPRAAHPQDVGQGFAGDGAPRPLRARAHHRWHRLSHRRRDRRKTRHPAQLNPARARRGRLSARTDGRRGPRLSRPSDTWSISSAPRSRWTRACGPGARGAGRNRRGGGRRTSAATAIARFISRACTTPKPTVAERMQRLTRGRPMGRAVVERAMKRRRAPAVSSCRPSSVRALRCALQSKRHRHHRRSRHRQDHPAALAACGAFQRRRRSRRSPRRPGAPRAGCRRPAGAKRRPSIACSNTRPRPGVSSAARIFRCAPTSSIDRRSLDDGCRAGGEPARRADARLLAAAGRRPRSAAVGRSRQRAQGRDRVGAGAGGRAAARSIGRRARA